MSDATTDGGFRVGQRVRISNSNDERHGAQGEIVPWGAYDDPPADLYLIQLDIGSTIARRQVSLMPVDDDEPDAPATPSLAEGWKQLREAAGDRWKGVDAREYVREMRGDATPEPRFKAGDPVHFTPYNDWGTRSATIIGPGRPSLTGEATWHIRFGDGEQASAFDGELKPMPQADPAADKPGVGQMLMDVLDHLHGPSMPQPADSKPQHYAALRDAGHEPWDVIRSCWPAAKAVAYHQGTALVYLMRADHKHPTPDDDIRKALAHLVEAVAILDEKGRP